jgi:hypothetical protein
MKLASKRRREEQARKREEKERKMKRLALVKKCTKADYARRKRKI